jgi:hypothetical protein
VNLEASGPALTYLKAVAVSIGIGLLAAILWAMVFVPVVVSPIGLRFLPIYIWSTLAAAITGIIIGLCWTIRRAAAARASSSTEARRQTLPLSRGDDVATTDN